MDNIEYEDQQLDELAYGRCAMCHQIEELNADDLCLVCEGIERRHSNGKSHWNNPE